MIDIETKGVLIDSSYDFADLISVLYRYFLEESILAIVVREKYSGLHTILKTELHPCEAARTSCFHQLKSWIYILVDLT